MKTTKFIDHKNLELYSGKVIRDPKLLWTSTDDPWMGCARELGGKVIRDPKLLWTSTD